MTDAGTVGGEPIPLERRPRAPAWLCYLTVGAAVSLAYLAVPDRLPRAGLVRVALYGGVSASAIVALAAGVRRHRPENPRPWYPLVAAQTLYLCGNVAFYTLHELYHRGGYPSLADALYLAHYPLVVAGVLLLARSRDPGADRASLIDASIIAVGFGVLSLVLLVEPTVAAHDVALRARLVSAAYPVMDMLVLAVAARLLVGGGKRRPAFHLLAASLALLLATDTVYSYLQLVGAYSMHSVAGKLLDAGWLGTYLLLGAAALHPSMRTLTDRDPRPDGGFGRGRLAFLAGAALLAPMAIVVEHARGEHGAEPTVAVACGVLVLLVVARLAGVLRIAEAGAAELRRRGAALEAALADLERVQAERERLLDKTMRRSEEEQSRIAAELHDGPIQRLTAVGYQVEEALLALEAADTGRTAVALHGVREGLSAEIGGLRGLLATLRPAVLAERGLTRALVDQLGSFERRTGVVCTLDHDGGDVRLEPDLETVLYRVTQEALSNVAKHAAARNVVVTLRADDDEACMGVTDDGIGFDLASAGELLGDGHFGLAGMRERVETAEGTYRLVSAPGSGTTIEVRLPRRRPP